MTIMPVKKRSQGAQANRTGGVAEGVIASILDSFRVNYLRQHPVGISIYGHSLKADFFLPQDDLIIESKWQDVTGSADEKLPYLVMNIRERYPYPTVIVYGGKGWKPGSLIWLRRQVDKYSVFEVLSVEEFMKWSGQRW